MKFALLLTGLQRNSSHFVANIRSCLIDSNNCDVFIYTSDGNVQREICDNEIKVVEKGAEPNFLDANQIKDVYGPSVREVIVDYGDKEMSNFMNYVFPGDHDSVVMESHNGRNMNVLQTSRNVISQFFKVRQAMLMVQNYEKEQGFKYDYILRLRMDSFFPTRVDLGTLVNTIDLTNAVFCPRLPFSYFHNNCDSLVLAKRDNAYLLRDFVLHYALKRHYPRVAIPEKELYEYFVSNGMSVVLGPKFSYRPGTFSGPMSTIPLMRNDSVNELNKRRNFYQSAMYW